MADAQNPAVECLRQEQKTQKKADRELSSDQKLERALKGTFPASDLMAQLGTITPGIAEERQ